MTSIDRNGIPTLEDALIHGSAWKGYSANFALKLSEKGF